MLDKFVFQFLSRKICYTAGIAAVLLGLFTSQTSGYILFNLAQLERIQGKVNPKLYLEAVAIQPSNSHFRWQAGEALETQGDKRAAIQVLLPLLNESSLQSAQFSTLINTFAGHEQSKLLLDFYSKMAVPPILRAQAAATLLQESLKLGKTLSHDRATLLISQSLAFAPTSPEFQLLIEQLELPNFWSTEAGRNLQEGLAWRARNGVSSTIDLGLPSNLKPLHSTDRQNVAKMLGIPDADVEIGPELLSNGDLTRTLCEPVILVPAPTIPPELCNLVDWYPSYMTTGNPWNRGTFIMGIDSTPAPLEARAVRINGLIIERKPDLELARAGIWHTPILLNPDVPYVISFIYRTKVVKELGATLWVSNESKNFFGGDHSFPPTFNTWKRVNIIGWNRSGKKASIQPLLRSFSEGTIWFADISVQSLRLKVPRLPSETIFDIRDVK